MLHRGRACLPIPTFDSISSRKSNVVPSTVVYQLLSPLLSLFRVYVQRGFCVSTPCSVQLSMLQQHSMFTAGAFVLELATLL